ncbi:MAG: MG2 domain-containing protein [Candidatus Sericytochromatia bacterium]
MKKKKQFLVFSIVTAFILSISTMAKTETAEDKKNYEKAEEQFNKHNYKSSIDYYKKYLKNIKDIKIKTKIALKILEAEKYSKLWDQLLEEYEEYKNITKDELYQARLETLMADVYEDIPHYGYKRDGKIFRNLDIREGEYTYLEQEDRKKVAEFYHSAKEKYAKQNESSEIFEEIIFLNFNFADFLQKSRNYYYPYITKKIAVQKKVKSSIHPINNQYNEEITKEIVLLYDEIIELNKTVKNKDHSARAIFKKASYFSNKNGIYFNYELKENEKLKNEDPMPLLWEIINNYGNSTYVEEAYFSIAQIYQAKQDMEKALNIYEKIIKKYPKSKLINDCNYHIQEIKRKELYFSSAGVVPSGEKPKINLTLRNIKNVSVNIYKLDMLNILKKNVSDYNIQFNNISQNFGYNINDLKRYYGKNLASFSIIPKYKNTYNSISEEKELPISKSGSYIVEVNGDDTIKSASIFLISDLVVVRNSDKDKILLHVLNRETGKPVKNANIIVKEHFYDYYPKNKNYYNVEYKQVKTNDDGFYSYQKKFHNNNNGSYYTDILAWKGEDITVSDAQYWYNYYYNNTRAYKGYIYTDRPVYRPNQRVNFKQIVKLREEGENKNVPNEDIKITITNPKGSIVYEKTLKTNDFGTLNDFYELPEKADLGVYNINTYLSNSNTYITNSSGHSFRVEEYKKPEFEVSVKNESKQVKPGDKIKVKVNTKYYFGSPVTEAKIHYKVTKSNFYYYYYRPQEYDWLYGDYYAQYNNLYGDPYASSGVVIKEGDLITDADGNTYIEFDSEKSNQDFKYDILVDAVDKSRRLIKGAGSVKVTNTSFYAFIDFENGFYAKNEKVKAEINLKTPDGEAVKEKGELKIYNVTYTGEKNDKEQLEILSTEKVESDKEGRIFYNWIAKKEGFYRFVFETSDKNNNKVEGKKDIWIAGDDFKGNRYKFRDVEVLTDKKTYEQGDTVRTMINTNHNDSFVMFYTETDNSILDHKEFHIPSKSKLYSFEVDKRYAPNFNIRVSTIKNNQLFNDQKEIFVPYSNNFINVELNTKKDIYSPSEKASIEIKTTTKDGKPIDSEVSLAMVDSSIYYIQNDLSGDIRKFYYGERRNLQNNLNSTLTNYFYPITENSEKLQNYAYSYYNPLGYGMSVDELDRDEFGGKDGNTKKYKNGGSVAKKAMMKADAPAPASAVAGNVMTESVDDRKEEKAKLADKESPKEPAKQASLKVSQDEIRSYFPDTAIWNPVVFTENGKANFDFTMPDSVTKWRIFSNAIDNENKVGTAEKEINSKKDLLVRLQAPRFFVERDEIIVSGIINNDFDKPKTVQCEIEFSDNIENTEKPIKEIIIPAKGEKRIDWRVKVKEEGTANITIKAVSNEDKDAMKMSFPVFVHGIDKNITENGIIKLDESKDINVKIPEQRKQGSTKLTITLAPSVLSNLMEALPYLVNYPYGCVEQTTSKFIPTVTVANTLKNMGIDISELNKKKKNTQIKEFSKNLDKKNKNPIYSNEEIDMMVEKGLERLYTFQNSDGGFGWWSGFYSDSYMSSYVINALMIAKNGSYNVDENVLDRATSYLQKQFDNKKTNYTSLYIAYVLSKNKKIDKAKLEPFFENRDEINDYGKALLSIAYSNLGDKEKADILCQNLKNTVKFDKDTNTASWDNRGSRYGYYYWWYWYYDRVETNAFILEAFLKARPKDTLNHAIANWLLLNRKSNHWFSTKDTANAIFVLSEYATVNKETNPDYEIVVKQNNKEIKKIKVNKDNMFTFDNVITLDDEKLDPSNNKFSISKKGVGNLYYSVSADFFTLEENIKASGNQISVKRDYFKVTEKKDEKGKIEYIKTPIKENETLKSGDIVEVKLTLKSNNDYEYLIFEDMKPSGFEATELKSGYVYQNGMYINQEFRDEKTIFFISNLPQGTQVLNYKLRAEIPGKFHVLPHKTYAMYAPEIKAISDEFQVGVED